MPVYEYHCPGCNERFERLEAISARDVRVECPSCGGSRAERLVSTFAAFTTGGSQATALGGGCCGGGQGGCACRA